MFGAVKRSVIQFTSCNFQVSSQEAVRTVSTPRSFPAPARPTERELEKRRALVPELRRRRGEVGLVWSAKLKVAIMGELEEAFAGGRCWDQVGKSSCSGNSGSCRRGST